MFSSSLLASSFCQRNRNDILNVFDSSSNRLAFKNAGGFFGGGVCWWHSRLQRSTVYLTKYAPERPKLPARELKALLTSLREMNEVITIPGYANFQEFSREYQKDIQSLLNQWQADDGVINQEWIRGLSGTSSLPADKMRTHMDELYAYYQQSPAGVWVMVQIRGITAHALLVLNMQKVANGYHMGVIDSNQPLQTGLLTYQHGQKNLQLPYAKYTFVPYVGFQKDFHSITAGLSGHCRGQYVEKRDIPLGYIEL